MISIPKEQEEDEILAFESLFQLVYISWISVPSCFSSALLPPQHKLGNPKHHGGDGHFHKDLSWGWSLQHKLGGRAVTVLHCWSDGASGALRCSTVLSADQVPRSWERWGWLSQFSLLLETKHCRQTDRSGESTESSRAMLEVKLVHSLASFPMLPADVWSAV